MTINKAQYHRKLKEFKELQRKKPHSGKLASLAAIMQDCVDRGMQQGKVWTLDAQTQLDSLTF